MATFGTQIRRGLPRRPGGDAWPPACDAPIDAPAEATPVAASLVTPIAAPEAVAETRPVPEAGDYSPITPVSGAAIAGIRRGLPRVPGGEPWPSASAAPVAAAGATSASPAVTVEARPTASALAAPPLQSTTALRRGLPRVAGTDLWPPAGFAPDRGAVVPAPAPADSRALAEPVPAAAGSVANATAVEASVSVPAGSGGPLAPLPFTRTVWTGASERRLRREPRMGAPVVAADEPERIGPFTKAQWAGAVVVGGIGLLSAAFMAVVAVRFLLSTDPLRDFLQTYPGEYHLPEGAPVGFPSWLGWQHFFNVFLMVLIIRSGLQVRTEKRPTAFWTPRKNPNGKVSLALWFHQSLDILWLVNGVIFVVLLFVSGQWMRVIPTSWEVFPNALSAVLQYISLDWPTENGWVNYNSVQQIAYFTTIFVAAPLAAITGARMTKLWPQNAKRLNRLYPIEWARAVHFPTMLYFCLFIFVHVVLVFATGALRNLNHMYAAQGSTDPNAYADNWAGFWIFFASTVVIAGAWITARPLILAPIARLFGTVSAR